VHQPERPARVEERRDEDQAERDPDPGGVDRAPDGAVVAAGELRLHLVVPPGLEHLAGGIADVDLGDLRSPAVLLDEVLDLPAARTARERIRLHVPALTALLAHRLGVVGDRDHFARGELETGRRPVRARRRLERWYRFAAEGWLRGGVVAGGPGGRGEGRCRDERGGAGVESAHRDGRSGVWPFVV
jgi:hypothetical protein